MFATADTCKSAVEKSLKFSLGQCQVYETTPPTIACMILQVYLQFELTLSSKEGVSDENSPTRHFFEKHECLAHCHIAKQCLLFNKVQLHIYSKISSLQTLVYMQHMKMYFIGTVILHENTMMQVSLFTLRHFQRVTYENST